eukprot:g5195.t1
MPSKQRRKRASQGKKKNTNRRRRGRRRRKKEEGGNSGNAKQNENDAILANVVTNEETMLHGSEEEVDTEKNSEIVKKEIEAIKKAAKNINEEKKLIEREHRIFANIMKQTNLPKDVSFEEHCFPDVFPEGGGFLSSGLRFKAFCKLHEERYRGTDFAMWQVGMRGLLMEKLEEDLRHELSQEFPGFREFLRQTGEYPDLEEMDLEETDLEVVFQDILSRIESDARSSDFHTCMITDRHWKNIHACFDRGVKRPTLCFHGKDERLFRNESGSITGRIDGIKSEVIPWSLNLHVMVNGIFPRLRQTFDVDVLLNSTLDRLMKWLHESIKLGLRKPFPGIKVHDIYWRYLHRSFDARKCMFQGTSDGVYLGSKGAKDYLPLRRTNSGRIVTRFGCKKNPREIIPTSVYDAMATFSTQVIRKHPSL